ncbi:hypothetical protein GCM10010191_50000 [Actinomadura vinacea]|uniref:Uncharacterized protein n=1 Tax=Actinomadura vinacea TaxID=115336 RepID=A0ABN3JKA8_9ACTN
MRIADAGSGGGADLAAEVVSLVATMGAGPSGPGPPPQCLSDGACRPSTGGREAGAGAAVLEEAITRG